MPKTLFLLLLAANVIAGQRPTLSWKSFQAPEYPQTARIAHIMGRTTVEFTLKDDGTATIRNTTGHPLLLQAAVDTIKSSRFACSACGRESVFKVEFDFSFAVHSCEEAKRHPRYTSGLEDPDRVSVQAEPVCTEDPRAVYANVR
ncbi:MAG TPA: energy transducer TonB, partial [Candidatus Angelobacter sp.]|nr:energy transducer TonB [Candidatus Angelobacter sp.]